MTDYAISIEHLSKAYRIGAPGARYSSLRESLMQGIMSPVQALRDAALPGGASFRALDDVSLTVERGEVLGLIGRNGAGKSTLLRILARITRPTHGRVVMRGRVGSLLDIGTGFHPELTGRENVFLNGAVLGMPRRTLRARIDQIAEFAGVTPFMETAVKHYSAGMRVRLAFAVVAHLDCEILLADEVLTVGDLAFQRRCMGRMDEMAHDGRAVVFVSHNMAAVGELCSRTALLDAGRLVDVGETRTIIRRYLGQFTAGRASVALERPREDEGVAITHLTISDAAGWPAAEIEWNDEFRIAVQVDVSQPVPALSLGIILVNEMGVRVLFSWIVFQEPFEAGHHCFDGRFEGGRVAPGRYTVDLTAERYGIQYYHVVEQALSFEIVKTSAEFGYELAEMGATYARVGWTVRPAADQGRGAE